MRITQPTAGTRNCSVDIFRIVFAILVVALHTLPEAVTGNPIVAYVICPLFRLSVPFFFMVSGYYFFSRPEKSTKNLGRSLRKILITYAVWSVPYLIIEFFSWGYQSLIGYGVQCVYGFFITGSYYHFWYFPALMFAVLISGWFLKKGKNGMLFVLSISLYLVFYVFVNTNLLHSILAGRSDAIIRVASVLQLWSSGLLYFNCGQGIKLVYERCSGKKVRLASFLLPVTMVLWMGLSWAADYFNLKIELLLILGIYLNVGIILLVLLQHPWPQKTACASRCRYLAIVLFYAHPLCIWIYQAINSRWLHLGDVWTFPIGLMLTLLFGVLLYRINNKHINRFVC